MRIVVIDYDQKSMEQLKLCIKKLGTAYEWTFFRNPVDVIEFVREHPVDMLITEVHLPEMSGFALANATKLICPSIYAAILTESKEYALEAWSRHIDDYLLKPISMETLEDSIYFMMNDSERR